MAKLLTRNRQSEGMIARGRRFVWAHVGALLLLTLSAPGCTAATPDSSAGEADTPAATAAAAQAAGQSATSDDAASDGFVRPTAEAPDLTSGDTIPGSPAWTRQDWEIVEATARWAWSEGVDSLPIGERIAAIGRRFVGTAYVPRTLDPPGDERLVVNLRALDCVTYVESMMTLAHLVRTAEPEILDDPASARGAYEDILTRIRYRDGRRSDYTSRLHYFSEWIFDGEQKGLVLDVTDEIGGMADPEPIDFMTSHPDSYDQLANPDALAAVRRIERELSARPRFYLPQDRVPDVASSIRTGDVIAATSTLQGLDIAHTGIALWIDGTLHLMHAPLVGEAVQISEAPLADRLLGISGQDGIMVARPIEMSGGESEQQF